MHLNPYLGVRVYTPTLQVSTHLPECIVNRRTEVRARRRGSGLNLPTAAKTKAKAHKHLSRSFLVKWRPHCDQWNRRWTRSLDLSCRVRGAVPFSMYPPFRLAVR